MKIIITILFIASMLISQAQTKPITKPDPNKELIVSVKKRLMERSAYLNITKVLFFVDTTYNNYENPKWIKLQNFDTQDKLQNTSGESNTIKIFVLKNNEYVVYSEIIGSEFQNWTTLFFNKNKQLVAQINGGVGFESTYICDNTFHPIFSECEECDTENGLPCKKIKCNPFAPKNTDLLAVLKSYGLNFKF